MSTPLPAPVRSIADDFLALIDSIAPGLVEGLYLHGSVGFDDFRPHRSDIDFIAVHRTRPDPAALDCIARAHYELGRRYPRPFFDGIHMTWDDLRGGPARCPDVPGIHEGQFSPACRFELSPVTWFELAHHGVRLRGPAIHTLDLWLDDHALWSYSHENLTRYWAPLVDRIIAAGPEAARPETTDWCVLGVPRLHHLLATGRLISKTEAGRYALSVFGRRWHPLIHEALRIRVEGAGGAINGYADPMVRLRDTVDFSVMAIGSALALPQRMRRRGSR